MTVSIALNAPKLVTTPRGSRPCAGGALGALFFAWTVVSMGGCAAQEPMRSPERTVSAFARALSDGKPEQAYALMDKSYRERVPFDVFKRELDENQREAGALAERLGRPAVERSGKVELRYHDFEDPVLLIEEDDHYRIASPLTEFYGQGTPRAALRSFVRALSERRYDVVLRLLPNADKTGLTTERLQETWTGAAREDLERLLANLNQALDAPIEVLGDHATMPYAEHRRMQFLREEGLWKVEDPE